MIEYAIISDDTGLVIGIGQAQNEFEAGVSGAESGTVVIVPPGVSPKPGASYFHDGGFTDTPPSPHDWLVWDGTTWVDPRSQADYDGALHHARMHTEIPTGLAIHKLAEIGAYPMAEIANDAVGIPATIREFVDLPDFPQFERDLMLAYFKTMPTVPRSMTRVFGPIHPDDPGDGYPSFIPWLATAKSITISPEQLDILWGVDVPPPLYTAP